jgi:hypothetical protein
MQTVRRARGQVSDGMSHARDEGEYPFVGRIFAEGDEMYFVIEAHSQVRFE